MGGGQGKICKPSIHWAVLFEKNWGMDGWTGLVLYRDSYVAMALSDGTKQKYINPDDWPI